MAINYISRVKQVCRQTDVGEFTLYAEFDGYQSVLEGVADVTGGNTEGEEFEAVIQYADGMHSVTWTRCTFVIDGGKVVRLVTQRTKEQGSAASTADVDDFDTEKDLIIYGTISEALKGSELVNDATPQLGGDLDVNGSNIINSAADTEIVVYYDGGDSADAAMLIDASDSLLGNAPALKARLPSTGSQKGFQLVNGTDSNAWASFEYVAGGSGKPGFALGAGAGARDTNIYREEAHHLKTDDSLTITEDLTVGGTFTNEYMVPIIAEETISLVASSRQFSFGNGAVSNNFGVAVYVPSGYTCVVAAMSASSATATTANIELVINGTANASANISRTAVTSATNELGSPVAVSDGDVINFETDSVTTAGSYNTVTAWLKYSRV